MTSFLSSFLIGFALLLGPIANAQTVIDDPHQIFNQVDQFVNPAHLPFANLLTCGDQASFDHPVDSCEIGCSSDGCSTVCQNSEKTVTHTVSACSADQVSIFSDDAENVEITASEFSTINGDLARKFMTNLSNYILLAGKISLIQATPANFSLDPLTPGSPSFSALNITGEFTPVGAPRGIEIMFTVLKDVPGVAQLARFRIGSQTWFRLKSIKKGT